MSRGGSKKQNPPYVRQRYVGRVPRGRTRHRLPLSRLPVNRFSSARAHAMHGVVVAAGIFAFAAGMVAAQEGDAAQPTAKTRHGAVHGIVADGVEQFRGLP